MLKNNILNFLLALYVIISVITLIFFNGTGDAGDSVIPNSIKLVAGRTGQEYNLRKNRKGAFWQDRYHATAVESNRHLRQCITYIDMNMVRAGVVDHPEKWRWCGYSEIQHPRKRKGIINFNRLTELLGFDTYEQLKNAHLNWIDCAVKDEGLPQCVGPHRNHLAFVVQGSTIKSAVTWGQPGRFERIQPKTVDGGIGDADLEGPRGIGGIRRCRRT